MIATPLMAQLTASLAQLPDDEIQKMVDTAKQYLAFIETGYMQDDVSGDDLCESKVANTY